MFTVFAGQDKNYISCVFISTDSKKFNYLMRYAVLEVRESETWQNVWHLASRFIVTSGYNAKVCGIRDKYKHQHSWTTTAWGQKVRQMNHMSPNPISRTKVRIQVFCDVTVLWIEWCHVLQRNITSVLLGLLDTWRCKYCVLSKLQKPYAEWRFVTSKKTCIISIITVRFESLTANILTKAILCTWKSKVIWMRMWRIQTHKKSQVF